jgi:hypothetical protein
MEPNPIPVPTIITLNEAQLLANEHAQAGVQASETFKLVAPEGTVLGGGGETIAFAKKDYGWNRPQIEAGYAANQAMIQRIAALENTIAGASSGVEQAQKGLATDEANYASLLAGTHAIKPDNPIYNQAVTDYQRDIATAKQTIAARIADGATAQAQLDQLLQGQENGVEVPGLKGRVDAALAAKTAYDADRKVGNISGALYTDSVAMQGNPNLGGDRNLLTRAVASTQVDQLIGTNVLSEEKFGVNENGQALGVSVQADGAGIKSDFTTNGLKKECFLNARYVDENIQRGLSDLEAIDYITGQIDRHPGNIFIDTSTGKVTGIDNDLAFPQAPRQNLAASAEFKGTESLPRFIHEETAKRILATKPVELRRTLEAVKKPGSATGLSSEEIDGAVGRLEELQRAIRDPSSVQRPDWERRANASDKATLEALPPFTVVQKFDAATYAQAVGYQNLRAKATINTTISECNKAADLNGVNRTSYLGSAMAMKRQTELNALSMPDRFGVRPPDTTPTALRNAAFVAHDTLERKEKADINELAKSLCREAINGQPLSGLASARKNDILTLGQQIKSSQDSLNKLAAERPSLAKQVEVDNNHLMNLQTEKAQIEANPRSKLGGFFSGETKHLKKLDEQIAAAEEKLKQSTLKLSTCNQAISATERLLEKRTTKLESLAKAEATDFYQNISRGRLTEVTNRDGMRAPPQPSAQTLPGSNREAVAPHGTPPPVPPRNTNNQQQSSPPPSRKLN